MTGPEQLRGLRLEPKASPQRCPLCHDVLAGVIDPEVCRGCGTEHHAVCLDELGRCATLGCGDPLVRQAGSARPTQVYGRQIRDLVRLRARGYREHSENRGSLDPAVLELFQRAAALEDRSPRWQRAINRVVEAATTGDPVTLMLVALALAALFCALVALR